MPGTPKSKKKPVNRRHTKNQRAGGGNSSNICQKDINQLLMGNPPVSIGSDDLGEMWRKTKTKEAAKELDNYTKKGWGNYPGTPPKPDCVIL